MLSFHACRDTLKVFGCALVNSQILNSITYHELRSSIQSYIVTRLQRIVVSLILIVDSTIRRQEQCRVEPCHHVQACLNYSRYLLVDSMVVTRLRRIVVSLYLIADTQ
jgi:hypothetical protein